MVSSFTVVRTGTINPLVTRASRGKPGMLSIGALAREAGVKVPTIRYYEQIGLLEVPPRTGGQQRRYDADQITARHLDAVDLRIAQLTALRNELKRMLDDCHGGCVAECRVIDSL